MHLQLHVNVFSECKVHMQRSLNKICVGVSVIKTLPCNVI